MRSPASKGTANLRSRHSPMKHDVEADASAAVPPHVTFVPATKQRDVVTSPLRSPSRVASLAKMLSLVPVESDPVQLAKSRWVAWNCVAALSLAHACIAALVSVTVNDRGLTGFDAAGLLVPATVLVCLQAALRFAPALLRVHPSAVTFAVWTTVMLSFVLQALVSYGTYMSDRSYDFVCFCVSVKFLWHMRRVACGTLCAAACALCTLAAVVGAAASMRVFEGSLTRSAFLTDFVTLLTVLALSLAVYESKRTADASSSSSALPSIIYSGSNSTNSPSVKVAPSPVGASPAPTLSSSAATARASPSQNSNGNIGAAPAAASPSNPSVPSLGGGAPSTKTSPGASHPPHTHTLLRDASFSHATSAAGGYTGAVIMQGLGDVACLSCEGDDMSDSFAAELETAAIALLDSVFMSSNTASDAVVTPYPAVAATSSFATETSQNGDVASALNLDTVTDSLGSDDVATASASEDVIASSDAITEFIPSRPSLTIEIPARIGTVIDMPSTATFASVASTAMSEASSVHPSPVSDSLAVTSTDASSTITSAKPADKRAPIRLACARSLAVETHTSAPIVPRKHQRSASVHSAASADDSENVTSSSSDIAAVVSEVRLPASSAVAPSKFDDGKKGRMLHALADRGYPTELLSSLRLRSESVVRAVLMSFKNQVATHGLESARKLAWDKQHERVSRSSESTVSENVAPTDSVSSSSSSTTSACPNGARAATHRPPTYVSAATASLLPSWGSQSLTDADMAAAKVFAKAFTNSGSQAHTSTARIPLGWRKQQ